MEAPLRPGPLARVRARLAGAVPAVVWIAAIAGVAWLYERNSQPLDLRAVATETTWRVSAEALGRIQTLAVSLDQRVEADQLIARLDGEHLLPKLSAARAELEHLRAELTRVEAERAELRREMRTDAETELRRFVRDVENAQIEYLQTLAEQEEDRVRATGLADELRRERELAGQRLTSDAELVRIETEHGAVVKRIDARTPVLEQLEARRVAAESRLAQQRAARGDEAAADDAALAPFRWRIEAQRARLEELAVMRARLSLHAPATGRIHRVLARAGEIVAAGEPVVEIIAEHSREIVAFVPSDRMAEVAAAEQRTAEIERHADRSRRLTEVVRVGTALCRVPDRITGDPRIVEYALPVYLSCPPDVALRPGELLSVELR